MLELSFSIGLQTIVPEIVRINKFMLITEPIYQSIISGTVSELHVSLAFVLYAGSSMISSLVFGPFIPRFGVEYLYYPGLITVALTNIALGALDLLPIGSYENYILAQRVVSSTERSHSTG